MLQGETPAAKNKTKKMRLFFTFLFHPEGMSDLPPAVDSSTSRVGQVVSVDECNKKIEHLHEDPWWVRFFFHCSKLRLCGQNKCPLEINLERRRIKQRTGTGGGGGSEMPCSNIISLFSYQHETQFKSDDQVN